MPLEGISRGFKDISFSFRPHPITGDLIALFNENAIARSLRNLVLTSLSERVFDQRLGCDVKQSLFENIDVITGSIIETHIRTTINNYEPRANIIDIIIEPDVDNNNFDVRISYQIIGLSQATQEINFVLESGR
jgi:phage baseplate assembly protein W